MKWAKTTLVSFKIDGDYVAVSKKVLDRLYSDNTAGTRMFESSAILRPEIVGKQKGDETVDRNCTEEENP